MARRNKRGFAQITQQRSGRYTVRYSLPNGARVSAGKTFERKADAEQWAVDKRREMERGPVAQRKKVTFADYADTWLANRHVAGRPIKPRTRAHYRALLDDHLLDNFGDRPLASITTAEVREWHAATLVDRPTLRSHAYSLLRTILASAVDDDLIAANPCRIRGAGRATRVHKIKPASVAELAELAAAMPERLQLMVLLASWCALRFGEIVELRRRDIDLTDEVIRIRRAAVRIAQDNAGDSGPKYAYLTTTPKSDAGVRDVSIPPHLVPVIEEHLAKFVKGGRDGLLFPADHGGHLQPSTLYRHWYKARAAVGRDDLRFHDLRHSGAVLAAASGATIAELMARLGHSTPQAAMRYQHAAQGRDREIAALLSKLAANGL
ncbi:site-specific integrase [Mycobacterium avium subsp. hominissuis]|uniref:tyrosine-type recombinase/integrase n=1 Tax=Mycobacterium avium TaxID=1764 RepID=UPI0003D2047D|nr:site-specific integrase [Mycobacterium avium]ETA99585.1 integrase [Mycobacterium avium 10-5581]ATO63520.2 site-specific integrase [Mycobacterium avium subsp. hominissuis]ATO68059.1 site-specific integrase [Mycobacterium avium subsp. hominissuis]ATO72608.1 site-specific integrase [Mycobacterium avium subsp. hominissuis]PBJ42964.1 site-specific integrase [Mycobacterium avium subsp. hominissuis]